jgi:uncharacterized membrane protein YjgN (DUF898 family)
MCAVTQQPPPPPPPGQPPYGGGYPPNQYGAPPFGGYVPPDHHQAVTVLILGILGLVLCQVISPFAWVMGNRVVREIDASNGQVGGRGTANAGRICGIVGTFLLAAGVLFAVVIVIIALAGVATSSTTSPY